MNPDKVKAFKEGLIILGGLSVCLLFGAALGVLLMQSNFNCQ
jgi:hypothetical protein